MGDHQVPQLQVWNWPLTIVGVPVQTEYPEHESPPINPRVWTTLLGGGSIVRNN
jgi:hypothetical protein